MIARARKNLLNNPFDVVEPPIFGADHMSSSHDYLMTTLWPYLFGLKYMSELVQRYTRENVLRLSIDRVFLNSSMGMKLLDGFQRRERPNW